MARRYEKLWRASYHCADKREAALDRLFDIWDALERHQKDHPNDFAGRKKLLEQAREATVDMSDYSDLAAEYDRRARRALKLAIGYGYVSRKSASVAALLGPAVMNYDLRCCYHEAGHVVMALLRGVDVLEVVVSRRSGGVTRFADAIYDPHIDLPIRLAGRAAEGLAFGNYSDDGCQDDATHADLAAFGAAGGDLAAADVLRAEVLEQVRDELVDHWATVETIVAALLESPNGRLDHLELPPTNRKWTSA